MIIILLSIKYYVRGTVLSTISWIISSNRYSSLTVLPPFTDEETEAQSCPESQTVDLESKLREWGWEACVSDHMLELHKMFYQSNSGEEFFTIPLQKDGTLFAHCVNGATETHQVQTVM